MAVLTALTVVGLPTLASRAPEPAPPAAAPHTAAATTARTGTAVGFDTIGLRRGGVTVLRGSLAAQGGGARYNALRAGWLPVAGDLDGDGSDSVSYFYNGTWFLTNKPGGRMVRVVFGRAGDRPVLGDWNGDGRDELGVFRSGLWLLRTTTGGVHRVAFGRRGDVPAVGDINGDGRTDLSVRRGSAFIQRSTATGPPTRVIRYGLPSDRPLIGDWNHDGRDEVGVFRDGRWFFRLPDGRTQATNYGRRGDVPFILRVPALAAGLKHGILRRNESVVQVAVVQMAAASTPDLVLARNSLGNLERTSDMGRRTNAVLAVNGDFFAPSGRPIHAYGADGALVQDPSDKGPNALGLTRGGATARANRVQVSVSFTPAGAATRTAQRFNRGTPVGNELAVFTTVSARVERVPRGGCYAKLLPTGARYASPTGVQREMKVAGLRCGGSAAAVPAGGVLLVGTSRGTSGTFIRALRLNQLVAMNQALGFTGTVGLVGANELLVSGGRIVDKPIDVPGAYAQGRQPRTAVGVTKDNRLVIVEVDGRQRGWSAGMTLRQLATLMRDLGVTEAVNLDGGGSSTFVLNGIIVNRPSDGDERSVAGALVVLRGADPGQAALRTGSLPATPGSGRPTVPAPADPDGLVPIIPGLIPGIPGLSPREQVAVRSAGPAEAALLSRDGLAAARDPGSTGGYAESQRLSGSPLDATLAFALSLFQAR